MLMFKMKNPFRRVQIIGCDEHLPVDYKERFGNKYFVQAARTAVAALIIEYAIFIVNRPSYRPEEGFETSKTHLVLVAFIVLAFYALRFAVRKRYGTTAEGHRWFRMLILAFLPVIWTISPDWHNEFATSFGGFVPAIWIGLPTALLAVPIVTFSSNGMQKGWVQLLEIIVLCPVWFVLSIFVQLILCFYWI
jgi:hypothetical protein